MAEEAHSVPTIHWKELFPFIVIFRSFRVAIHPSKLVLALVALIIVYAGGTVMDALLPRSQMAVRNELGLYEQSGNSVDRDQSFARLRADAIDTQDQWVANQKRLVGRPNGTLDDLRRAILNDRDRSLRSARSLDDKHQIYATASERLAWLDHSRAGLFESFSSYELGEINVVVHAVRSLNLIGPGGVTTCVFRLLAIAPAWAIKHHPLFFGLYALFFLVIWAVFGGAITRIAAVHYARDEKISIRQALAFSTSKFLSFVSAPIIPIIIILFLGLIAVAAGIVLNLPFVGPIVIGAAYFLVLVVAFLMTLVVLGLVGGVNLMYPTIAVEGSDSFDAISRSFTYLYARPWRLAFYTLVGIAYGAITYMFVRYFLYLLLSLAHLATGIGVFTHAKNAMPLWQTMWPSPSSIGRLSYSISWMSLTVGEKIGAACLAFWVYLMIALLGAYAISFYFSVNTVIYYLLRREVDATELDDVYLEQADSDFGDVAMKPSEGADPAGGATDISPAAADMASGAPVSGPRDEVVPVVVTPIPPSS